MNNQNYISKVRQQFPILAQVEGQKPLVYLDNAATSQKPLRVINTISEYYKTSNANIHRGIYDLSNKSTHLWEQSHKIVADFINADSAEVFFVRNTTEGINAVADIIPLTKGDVIVTTEIEHHSNILPWQKIAKRTGAKLEWIPVLEDFTLDLDYLEFLIKKFKDRVKVVAITHVSNTLGNVVDVKKVADMVHHVGGLVVVDGAQAVAHMPVDVKALDCDFYVFSGHKSYAANGAGVVYGKRDLLEKFEPFLRGGGMITDVTKNNAEWAQLPEKFEAGTPDVASGVSLAASILWLQEVISTFGDEESVVATPDLHREEEGQEQVVSNMEKVETKNYLAEIEKYDNKDLVVDKEKLKKGWEEYQKYEGELIEYLLRKLKEIPQVRIFGTKKANDRIGLVAFEIDGVHAHDVAGFLNDENIAVRAGMHCTHPLHRKFGFVSSTRISFSLFNTKEEIDKVIAVLYELLDKLL